jgi:hypothetical protein
LKIVNGKAVKEIFHYEGQWKNGVYHGDGKLVIMVEGGAEGKVMKGGARKDATDRKDYRKDSYTGEFKAGLRHGEGHYLYSNGDEYHGEFKRGKCHGHGTFVEAGGESVFIGEYKDSLRSGNGLCFSRMPPPPLLDEEASFTKQSSLGPPQQDGGEVQPEGSRGKGEGQVSEGWAGDLWQVYDGVFAKDNRQGHGKLSIMLDPEGALAQLRSQVTGTGHGGTEAVPLLFKSPSGTSASCL